MYVLFINDKNWEKHDIVIHGIHYTLFILFLLMYS